MRRCASVRLTLLPILAASSLALAQERPCLDGTTDDDCLRADPQVSASSVPVVYPLFTGGFGGYFWAGG
jgi:hypothetical protein